MSEINHFLKYWLRYLIADTLDIEEDVVMFKVECRELNTEFTSSGANQKGVFILSWPHLHGITSFQKSVFDRFSISKVTALYYYDGFDVMCLNSDDDLRVCLGYFKRCSVMYRDWIGFCKIYALTTYSPDANLKQSSHTSQADSEVKISMSFSDLVYRIMESYSTAIIFQTMDSKEENVLRFAFRVHSKYGNQLTIVSEDVVFCCTCNKSIKLNKHRDIVNVDEHVKRQQCCKEKYMLGMYLWAMGAHVAKLKGKLLALSETITCQKNDDIRKTICDLYSMPQDILSKIEKIETFLSTNGDEIYLDLLRDVKRIIKPWNTYQELRNSADTKKRVEVTISMEGIDEASALLFFTTIAETLNKNHVFYQETHSFLWEAFNKGKLTNFCEQYKTLNKFQERLQFKFGKSCSYLLRGKAGAGQGKQSSLSLKEYIENRNFAFVHPNTISKRNPCPTFTSTDYKGEILTAIDLLVDFEVKPVDLQTTVLKVFLVNKSTDGMQLKPAMRYAPQLHQIVGLEDPPFLAIDQVKDLCNMSNEELAQYLKSLDFVSEAQEFRIASLDGLVSFPIGCFYRSCKGGANKVKIYDRKTEELLQACKNCILNSSKCIITCSTCDEEGVICDECQSLGYVSTNALRRKCKLCQQDGLTCLRMHEMSWVSDSEAAQRAYMTALQGQNQKVPIPDPPHVLKLVRSSLFNYWTFVSGYLVCLKLLSSARGDADEDISKPIARELPRSCLRNKDQMNMKTAVALFRKQLLDTLPDGPIVATLIPERDQYWRQNPSNSVLKFPTAVAFSSKNSLLFICDKQKSTIFMANLHNPVCAIPIAGPKTGMCSPQGILIKDNHLVVISGGNTSGLKIIDVKELLNKSRALLQLETNDVDEQPAAEASSRASPSDKVKVYDVCFWSTTELTEVGRLVSVATSPNSENEPLGLNTTIFALSFDKKAIYKISQFDFDIQQKRYNAQLEIHFVLSQGQPLCIYDALEGLLISVHNQGIKCLHHENDSFRLTNVVERNPSVILGITKTEEKLVFSDCHNHSVNFFSGGKIRHSLGGNQGMQDGFTLRFQSPSALVSYGESIFVCDTSNKAIRIISSLTAYKFLGKKVRPFIELFQLEEERSRKVSVQSSLEDGLKILKEVADLMKDIERGAYFRTGRRCPQGPDLALTKPTRDAFNMLHSSFQKTKLFLSKNNLQHIAEDIFFPSFTTLHVEHFFAGMRTPCRPTPDMHDYASRRPSCIIESMQRVYNPSFSMYTGPQSHYTERKIEKKEPEWLYERAKNTGQNKARREDSSKEKDVLQQEARDLRLFAKEFGQGVRQQRVRDKTKERAGTLPLALTICMI